MFLIAVCNAWLWNSKVSPWYHLLILCFHHRLQCDMKWRQAWKELTEGGGSMWWYDHSLLCFGLLCACVCMYACKPVCVWMFECVHICAGFESRLALISMFSVQHLPPPYCCRIRVQEIAPVGPEKWACTSISLPVTGLECWAETLLLLELTTWQAVIFHQCCITAASINWNKRMWHTLFLEFQ